jgi:hypothetical protein
MRPHSILIWRPQTPVLQLQPADICARAWRAGCRMSGHLAAESITGIVVGSAKTHHAADAATLKSLKGKPHGYAIVFDAGSRHWRAHSAD